MEYANFYSYKGFVLSKLSIKYFKNKENILFKRTTLKTSKIFPDFNHKGG